MEYSFHQIAVVCFWAIGRLDRVLLGRETYPIFVVGETIRTLDMMLEKITNPYED